jgi:citrate synthase
VTSDAADARDDAPQFLTAVSRVAAGRINIRGYDCGTLIAHASASEGAFLTLIGRRPTDAERRLFDAVLCSCLDHGLVNTLSVAARYVASGSATLPSALAAGILCFGPYTGSPHLTAELLDKLEQAHGKQPPDTALDRVIEEYRVTKIPVPGFGHPIHRTFDPRTEAVQEVARAVGLLGPSVTLLYRIRERLSAAVGRALVLNVDGLMAGLLRDIGFTPVQILATNILAAMPGIAAHAIEEMQSGKHLRFPPDHDRSYLLPEEARPWDAVEAADRDPPGRR